MCLVQVLLKYIFNASIVAYIILFWDTLIRLVSMSIIFITLVVLIVLRSCVCLGYAPDCIYIRYFVVLIHHMIISGSQYSPPIDWHDL